MLSRFPLSRRYERTYHDFFSAPYYWIGNGLWGNYPIPGMTVPPEPELRPDAREEMPEEHPNATHLRSVREVTGCAVVATDGEAGRIDEFLVDDRTWALRYAVVEWSRLPVSRKTAIEIERILEANWVDRRVRVDMKVEQIEEALPFDPRAPVNQELETVLYDYYGRPRGRAADRF